MIFVYNERQGVRDGQTVMASCLYIYGDRSAHGMRSLFIVYNILFLITIISNIFSITLYMMLSTHIYFFTNLLIFSIALSSDSNIAIS